MFEPELLEENDKFIKLKIIDTINLTIDYDLLESDGELKVDFDENVHTAEEAEKLTRDFLKEVYEFMEKKIKKENLDD